LIPGFDSIFEVQRALYANAVQALNALQAGGAGALPSLAAAAFAFGMLHALLPGHGKSVLASYYAADGRWRGALGSSLLLILTHVGSAVVLVLSGYAILRHTIGGAGRAPALEQASQILIVLIGLWLLWRSFRPHHHHHDRSAPLLAIATGLIPCPLTTFIMTYAVVHGAVKWGLLLSALFAAGMTFTVALFPLTAVLARTRLLPLIARTEAIRNRVASAVEVCAAIAIIAVGALPLLR
jgi:nickel/cobalt exporter